MRNIFIVLCLSGTLAACKKTGMPENGWSAHRTEMESKGQNLLKSARASLKQNIF